MYKNNLFLLVVKIKTLCFSNALEFSAQHDPSYFAITVTVPRAPFRRTVSLLIQCVCVSLLLALCASIVWQMMVSDVPSFVWSLVVKPLLLPMQGGDPPHSVTSDMAAGSGLWPHCLHATHHLFLVFFPSLLLSLVFLFL